MKKVYDANKTIRQQPSQTLGDFLQIALINESINYVKSGIEHNGNL